MGDIIDNEEQDKDTVAPDILDQQFTKKYALLTEQSVSLKKSYINSLCATKSLQVAASQTDHSIEVFQLTNSALSRVCRLSGHPTGLTELVASTNEEHLLYSSGADGVKLWDLRKGGSCAQHYKDNESRPVQCLSVSCTGRVLCGGTALIQDDAFMLFWDTRQTEPLGGYWNSHADDITQVRFHPTKPSTLYSGSTDGCVNIYDITQSSEDDALLASLPVSGAVERLGVLRGERLGVVTACHQCCVCDVETGDVVGSYDRERVAKGMRRSKSSDCYLVDTFTTKDGDSVVLAGSYADEGVLRSVLVGGKRVQPHATYKGGEGQLVRCAAYHDTSDTMLTGGERGILSVWRHSHGPPGGEHTPNGDTHKLTHSLDKLKVNRFQPY